jgi:hypothetical protein
MKALHATSGLFLAVLLSACSDPQTPASSGSATSSPSGSTPSSSTATAAPATTPSAGATATQAPADDKLTQPYVLTYSQHGGIAGLRMELVLDSAAKKITYGGLRNQDPQTKELSPDEIAAITHAIEEARFNGFNGALKGAAPADAFSYAVTVKTGGQDHTVSWTDGVTVPAPLDALRTAITRLRETKFSGKAAAGAPTK